MVLIIVWRILRDAGALSVGRPFKCTLRVLPGVASSRPAYHTLHLGAQPGFERVLQLVKVVFVESWCWCFEFVYVVLT